MIRALSALSFAALLLTLGCAPQPPGGPAPPPTSESYRALGTEPFWSVTIEGGRMTYERAGQAGFSVATPPARTTFNGRRYETPRLTVDISHAQCSDGMSDRIYADTVMVMVDGETLRGCGGETLPPAELAGTNWAITAIDGEATPREPAYFLNFTEDRLSGKAGCNSFNGSYQLSEQTLTAGPLATTRMACPGPAMDHERRALEILGGPVQLDYQDGDTLILTGQGGTITLRRSI